MLSGSEGCKGLPTLNFSLGRSQGMLVHYVFACSGPDLALGPLVYLFLCESRDLAESHLPTFEACVRAAKVGSIMCAYNRWGDGFGGPRWESD